jgi:hypothetical protein
MVEALVAVTKDETARVIATEEAAPMVADAIVAAVRKPLTAQRLDKLIEAHVGGAEIADGEYSAMVIFAAAVERAHGIGA